MAVIIVPAAAMQANTTLIHTIQAHTDDAYDTVIYIQYIYINTMANQRKTSFWTWAPKHLGEVSFPRNLAHFEQNTY
jgi:hypothetical protein